MLPKQTQTHHQPHEQRYAQAMLSLGRAVREQPLDVLNHFLLIFRWGHPHHALS